MAYDAIQGVSPFDLFIAVDGYLKAFSGLQERFIMLWQHESIRMIQGAQSMIFYRLDPGEIDQSAGPQRYGNKYNIDLNINIITRSLVDGAQRDFRKMAAHLGLCFRVIDSFQNLNLFSEYVLPKPDAATAGIWRPLAPIDTAKCLTVGTMLVKQSSFPMKPINEEGTILTSFTIMIPAVLNLSIVDENFVIT